MPKVPFWVFIVIAILYFTAARVDTMDIDASQYAEMSREMAKSGDYLHLYDRGMNYLDKPSFLFWVNATSMNIFGVNNFGYKLPSILFALLAIFATYRLARLLYGEVTGRIAALVLATCQGMFLMTNDVRCDTILMSWVMTAVWLVQEWVVSKKFLYLMGGCAAIAFGMMTKGPIALMVPVFCFISDWTLKRQWKNFLSPAYIPGLILIAILLIPMSIGLYQQYDLHPEAMVDGKTHVSGLRFFFWSQSFGRITGESPWKNDVDITFLLSNMLWSYLPWVFLLLPALFINVRRGVIQKLRLRPDQEAITTGGFLITYLALGSSSYQLPHYIFVAFPLASVIVARLIYELVTEKRYVTLYKVMKPFLLAISALIFVLVLVLIIFVFPAPVWVVIAWAAGLAVWLIVALRKSLTGKLLWISATAMIVANVFLTNYVYATLLQYQVGSQAGRYIHAQGIPTTDVAIYKMEDPLNSIGFYAQGTFTNIDTSANTNHKKYILTMGKGLADLKTSNVPFTIEKQGPVFKVSELTPDFLNPGTRWKTVKTYYLVRLNGQ